MKNKYLNGTVSGIVKAFIYLWALFIVFVFLWIILASLKTDQTLFGSLWSLPNHLHWDNYYRAWVKSNISGYFLNSIIVTISSLFGILLLSCPAAYILARVPFKGREGFTVFFIIGIGIPFQAVLIPLYELLTKLGLINSLFGLIVVEIAVQIPFTVFILTGFFNTISRDFEEVAAIDGASANRTFWQIILPMARPGLITVIILNGVSIWNEFILAKAFLNDDQKFTLPVGLYQFYQQMRYNSDWVALFAGVIIIVLPILIFYLWVSNRIIEGMTMGSGK